MKQGEHMLDQSKSHVNNEAGMKSKPSAHVAANVI